jgi:hypothetical protein
MLDRKMTLDADLVIRDSNRTTPTTRIVVEETATAASTAEVGRSLGMSVTIRRSGSIARLVRPRRSLDRLVARCSECLIF